MGEIAYIQAVTQKEREDMKEKIKKLIDEMWANYGKDVEDEGAEQSGAEMLLDNISTSKLQRIEKILEEYNIYYWLSDKIKFNPTKQYILWISKTRGSDPVWGISPVTAD